MDAGKVFVLILTAFSIGILVYLEVTSRRSRNQSTGTPPSVEDNANKTPGEN
jgi:hypothetical protein